VWVGVSKSTRSGHAVVPIEWNTADQCFRLGKTVETVIVKVYDNVFLLRMEPPNGEFGTQEFSQFVDSLMEPVFNKHPIPGSHKVNAGPDADSDVAAVAAADLDACTVEVIKKSRVKKGVVQHLIKWVGYNNKHNSWVDCDDMKCDELIAEFECASALSASVQIDPRDTLQTESEVTEQSSKVFGPGDVFAKQAVAELMQRQSMPGVVDDYLLGYKTEISNILRRRMSLQDPAKACGVRAVHALGKLRMLLELKRDGRKKGS
jgi:hypothetical protein